MRKADTSTLLTDLVLAEMLEVVNLATGEVNTGTWKHFRNAYIKNNWNLYYAFVMLMIERKNTGCIRFQEKIYQK
ncbi:hypothetical protein V6R21_20350 [Limibacter armeniacum]|uniref:hypothetical protein n=1 Tax=Limibacter armeniacum TaxID=466084 RepID=UPI002FE5308F